MSYVYLGLGAYRVFVFAESLEEMILELRLINEKLYIILDETGDI